MPATNPSSPVIFNPSNAEAALVQITRKYRFLKNHLNPVMLVFFGKLSLNTLRREPVCQGFSHFSDFLYHFVLAKFIRGSCTNFDAFH